ncbi:PQ-loop-domain-containing protein, partial [Backusella circina FSU 941]
SDISGYISIVFWLIVFLPQLHKNYSRQSGSGLSLSFLIIWLVGDLFNLVGVILQKLMFTMFLLALWYTVADICLIWQVLYYNTQEDDDDTMDEAIVLQSPISNAVEETLLKRELSLTKVDTNSMEKQTTKVTKQSYDWVYGLGLILLIGLSFYCYYYTKSSEMSALPQTLGWSSAILYIGSRLPQIMKNWRQKSTDGLSPGMFICAVLGNIFFSLSIFLRSTERTYLLVNLSWIIGSLATVLFDMIIFFQFYAFDHRTIK